MMKNRNRLIVFTKEKLNKLKWDGKQRFYFAKNQEALCLGVNKFSKTYYAHWSTTIVGEDGRLKSVGHKKQLGGFEIPLDEIKQKLRENIDKWKANSKRVGSAAEITLGDLVKSFIKYGLDGNRVRTRGKRLKYKQKTADGYKASLRSCILLEGQRSSQKYKDLFNQQISYKDTYITGAIKDVPLSKITREDFDKFMHVMQDFPVAANNALAACSVAFEWDMTLASKRLFKGTSNPCLRVVKYEVQKDKRHLDLETANQIRSYIENNIHKNNSIYQPHFLAYLILLIENGERQEDFQGLYWQEPNNIEAAKAKGCTGWLDLKNGTYYLIDSKNRKDALEDLSDNSIRILNKLNEMRYESLSWCIKSKWVFPCATDIENHITSNSYRWQRDRFFHKFGLATRELVRSRGKQKLYKYKCQYTFKHLRKTFATLYAKHKGDVATQKRMRHVTLEVTQNHYITEDTSDRKKVDIFSPKQELQHHKLAAVKGGKDD